MKFKIYIELYILQQPLKIHSDIRDGDLHSLNPFRGIPIVTISNFTKMFS